MSSIANSRALGAVGGRNGRGALRGGRGASRGGRGALRGGQGALRGGRGAARGGRGASRGGRGGRGAARGGRGGRGGRGRGRGGRGGGGRPPRGMIPRDELENAMARRAEQTPDLPPYQQLKPSEVLDLKSRLLNTVSAALIREPRFAGKNSIANRITSLVVRVAFFDPEFVLKLAVYVRDELGIRTTSALILALASSLRPCQPFVRKYFKFAVRLPSDWLDVAATYRSLPHRPLKGNSLPSCLRKAMIDKFPDFDVYQLGKYNKERTLKRKARRKREFELQFPDHVFEPDAKPVLTLKAMIRQLHIAKPVAPVMSLIGKKYPSTFTEFQRSGLAGEFDRSRAGQRMKLPVPETWETLVSAKGNKASTWEELIEHKKLPFMAMLRNIRNLILTGVKPRYHRWVQNKLMNEQTIANSRQFPFRFFSAFEVIPRDLEHFNEMLAEANGTNNKHQPENAKLRFKLSCPPDKGLFDRYRAALDEAVKLATKHNVEPITGATAVFVNIADVMKADCAGAKGMGGKASALDEIAVLLALMCRHASEDCDLLVFAGEPTSASTPPYLLVPRLDGAILNNIAPVLSNRSKLAKAKKGSAFFPTAFIEECIRDHRHIDNLLVLSHEPISGSSVSGASGETLGSILSKYRADVNPDLLFVSVDLSSRGGGVNDGSASAEQNADGPHPNDVQIAGFSDAILRFIAQRGDATQLQHVENIDRAKGITKPDEDAQHGPVSGLLAATYNAALEDDPDVGKRKKEDVVHDALDEDDDDDELNEGAWREARVFLSSTFIDMHGERDILTRTVFPELRRRAQNRRVRVREIDLRWGVTAEEAASGSTIGTCLREVDRCRPFFVGLLGHRYGWRPDSYVDSLTEQELDDVDGQLAWLKNYPTGRSVTELEIQHGALRAPSAARAFFYIRDQRFMHDVPKEFHSAFAPANVDAFQSLESLKEEIRAAHMSHPDRIKLFDQYPCQFDSQSLEVVQPPPPRGSGLLDQSKYAPVAAKPMPKVKGLDKFAAHMLEQLWNAIDAEFPQLYQFPELTPAETAELEERRAHRIALEMMGEKLIGRSTELERVRRFSRGVVDSELMVTGEAGCGKSAILAVWAREQRRAKALRVKPVLGLALPPRQIIVLYHFVGVSDRSCDVQALVRRMCTELLIQLPNLELPEFESASNNELATDADDKRLTAVQVLTCEKSLPVEWTELQECFESLLTQAALMARVFMMIDGVDRLRGDDGTRAHQLEWLPQNTGVKVLMSACPNTVVYDAAVARKARLLEVGALAPKARTRLVATILASHSKKLSAGAMNDQMRVLVRKQDASSPLYLLIACEELRVFGVYERLTERIGAMASRTPQLLDEVLERVENDQPHPQLARHALAALALSRDGLTEKELCGSLDMPLAYWAPLRNALGSYLSGSDNSAPLRFFNIALKRAICTRYGLPIVEAFDQGAGKSSSFSSSRMFGGSRYATTSFGGGGSSVSVDAAVVHGHLADYFGRKHNARAVRELPYHLLGAKRLDALQTLLLDIEFVQQKCAAGAVADLMDDYTRTRAAVGGTTTSSYTSRYRGASGNAEKSNETKLKEMSVWLRSCLHVLVGEPNLTFQLAANAPRTSEAHIAAARHWKTMMEQGKGRAVGTWLRWMNAPQSASPLRGSLPLPTTALALAVCTNSSSSSYSTRSSYGGSNVASTDDALLPAGGSALIAVALRDCTIRVYAGDTGDELAVLTGHSDWSVTLDFSPDGASLASGSWDNTVKIFDVTLGTCESTMKGHRRRVSGVQYSNDGRYVASSGADCKMLLWDPRETRPKKTYNTVAPVSDVAFSPDDNQVLGALWNGSVAVFDTHEATLLKTFRVSAASLQRIAFRGNGRQLAVTDARGNVTTFAASSGTIAATAPRMHTLRGTSCAFDGVGGSGLGGGSMFDGGSDVDERRMLLSTGADGEISVCAAASGTQLWRWPDATVPGVEEAETDRVMRPGVVAVSSAGAHAVVGSDAGQVYLFDVVTQQPVKNVHRYNRPVTAVAFAPNNKFFASTTDDGIVHLFSHTGDLLRKYEDAAGSPAHQLVFTSDNKHLVLASDACAAFVFAVNSNALVARLKHDMPVRSVAACGNYIATGSNDGFVHLWSMTSNWVRVSNWFAHRDWINALAFTEDSKKLAVGSADNVVSVWNVRNSQQITECKGHKGGVQQLFFASPQYIVSAAADGTVRMFCASSGAQLTAVSPHNKEDLTSVCLLGEVSDGTLEVLTCGRDHSLCATSLLQMNQLISLRHGRDVRAAFVTAGGGDYDSRRGAVPDTIVASCARSDSYVRLWRIPPAGQDDATNKEEQSAIADQARLRLHNGPVHSVAVSPTGSHVATAGADGKVCIVPLQQGSRRIVRLRHVRNAASKAPRGVRFVTWSANGQQLLTAGDDGVARVWTVDERGGARVKTVYSSPPGKLTHRRQVLTAAAFHHDTVIAGGWSTELMLFIGKSKANTYMMDGWITSIEVKGEKAVVATRNGDISWFYLTKKNMTLIGTYKLKNDFARHLSVTLNADAKLMVLMACNSGNVLCGGQTMLSKIEPEHVGKQQGRAMACALSPQGSRALSVGADGRLSLWSTRRHQMVAAFDRFAVPLTSVSFGDSICVGDAHGGVSVLSVIVP